MRNGEGARLSIFAGLAQSAEQPSRKRQARCSSHRTSTICAASIEAMQPPCKRRSRFRFPAGAPCSLSSFGRAPGWYLGGGWIEATREHHFAPIAQLAEAHRSERCSWEFESPSVHHCPCTQTGKAACLKNRWLEIRFLPRAPRRGSSLAEPAAPDSLPLSSEEERRSYKPKVEISKFSAGTRP